MHYLCAYINSMRVYVYCVRCTAGLVACWQPGIQQQGTVLFQHQPLIVMCMTCDMTMHCWLAHTLDLACGCQWHQ